MRPPTVAVLALALAALALGQHPVSAQSECREYYSKGVQAPKINTASDTISVTDGFPLGSVGVRVDLSHRRIGALVVSLVAQPPAWAGAGAASRRVVLKERGLGRLGDNMYMTTFSDEATDGFPVAAEAAPFRGKFRPTQRLSFLHDDATPGATLAGAGGSQGDWVLRVDDVAPNATIRPIALNGWSIRLCPQAPVPSNPGPATGGSVPVPPINVPTPAPAPGPAVEQPVTGFQGPGPAPVPGPTPYVTLPGGWKMVTNTGKTGSGTGSTAGTPSVSSFQGASQTGTGGQNTQTLPAPGTGFGTGLFGGGGIGANPADPFGIAAFQISFNSYLQGRYGTACADPACSNVKLRFWKAALGLAYMKARFSGKADTSELLNKLRDLLPGPNPMLGKMSDWATNWQSHSTEILQGLSQWYDKVQRFMAGNTAGLEALLQGAMGGGAGLKSLGIDPAAAAQALAPLLGLESPEEGQALMEGLQEAGFGDMVRDWLEPSGGGMGGLGGFDLSNWLDPGALSALGGAWGAAQQR